MAFLYRPKNPSTPAAATLPRMGTWAKNVQTAANYRGLAGGQPEADKGLSRAMTSVAAPAPEPLLTPAPAQKPGLPEGVAAAPTAPRQRTGSIDEFLGKLGEVVDPRTGLPTAIGQAMEAVRDRSGPGFTDPRTGERRTGEWNPAPAPSPVFDAPEWDVPGRGANTAADIAAAARELGLSPGGIKEQGAEIDDYTGQQGKYEDFISRLAGELAGSGAEAGQAGNEFLDWLKNSGVVGQGLGAVDEKSFADAMKAIQDRLGALPPGLTDAQVEEYLSGIRAGHKTETDRAAEAARSQAAAAGLGNTGAGLGVGGSIIAQRAGDLADKEIGFKQWAEELKGERAKAGGDLAMAMGDLAGARESAISDRFGGATSFGDMAANLIGTYQKGLEGAGGLTSEQAERTRRTKELLQGFQNETMQSLLDFDKAQSMQEQAQAFAGSEAALDREAAKEQAEYDRDFQEAEGDKGRQAEITRIHEQAKADLNYLRESMRDTDAERKAAKQKKEAAAFKDLEEKGYKPADDGWVSGHKSRNAIDNEYEARKKYADAGEFGFREWVQNNPDDARKDYGFLPDDVSGLGGAGGGIKLANLAFTQRYKDAYKKWLADYQEIAKFKNAFQNQ